MNLNRLGKLLGIAALCGWAAWWLVSIYSRNLVGAEHLWIRQPWLGADFWSQPDYAARLRARGGDPYANEVHLFHYPPIVIRLFAWTPFLPYGVALIVWMSVIVALIVMGTLQALRTRRELGERTPPAPLVVAAVLFTFPILYCVERSNFDIIVLASILGALYIGRSDEPRRQLVAGMVLSIAPWVKVYPGLMVAGLLAARRFRMLAGFVVGGILIGLLTPRETIRSFQILGIAVHRNVEMAIVSPYHVWMHSLSVAWIRVIKALERTSLGSLAAAIPPNAAALGVIGPLLGWVCLAVHRANPERRNRILYPLLLWICALASFLPAIANDYSLLYLPIAAVATYGRTRGRLAHASMAASLPWWQPYALPIPAMLLLVCKLGAMVAVGESIVRAVEEPGTQREAEPTPSSRTGAEPAGQLRIEPFTVGLGALLLEIAYTRIFAFKAFYHLTYALFAAALVGVAFGRAAFVAFPFVGRIPRERLVPWTCFAAGAAVLAGYVGVAYIALDLAANPTSPLEIAKLVLSLLLVALPFCGVGVVLGASASSRPKGRNFIVPELAGAASGCALAVPLITLLSPPRTVAFAGLVLAASGLPLARRARRRLSSGIAVVAALALPSIAWGLLPDPAAAASKALEARRSRIWSSSWTAVSRVDVASDSRDPGGTFFVHRDGVQASTIRHFDGKLDGLRYVDGTPLAWPFDVARRQPTVLVFGTAAAQPIVASLHFDAAHVTDVEQDPSTYSLLTTTFAGISGHLATNPRVTLVEGDGRWFAKRTRSKFDLVWLVAPEADAGESASTAAAATPSESYLYTVEAIREALRLLEPGGVLCAQFAESASEPDHATRYVATARAALAEEGVEDLAERVLVGSAGAAPTSTVLASRTRFTPEQVDAFVRRGALLEGGKVLYAPGAPTGDGAVQKLVTLPSDRLPVFFWERPHRVDPVRDDAPFFQRFARFGDAFGQSGSRQADVLAERTIALLAGLVLLLVAAAAARPFTMMRRSMPDVASTRMVTWSFAGLGAGSMMTAVALIQELTLLLGRPTYALSVTLLALLAAAGGGGIVAARYGAAHRRGVTLGLGALAAALLAGQALLPALTAWSVGGSVATRIVVAVVLTAPVGLCLGALASLVHGSLVTSGNDPPPYAAWAHAVGAFSAAAAAVPATMVAMAFGFRVLIAVAFACTFTSLYVMVRSEGFDREPGRTGR